MLQSGHGSRDRRTDGQTDRQTDGVKPIYPPTTSLFGGYNYTCICFISLHWYNIGAYVIHNDIQILFGFQRDWNFQKKQNSVEQGKSEGFESCDRPIVWKRPNWVKMGDVLSRVTLKFDRWPWKTIGHLSVAVSSFVQHFIDIGEFKLEFQSGNAQFGSNSTIFRAVWPWNLTYDLEKQ